MIEGIDQTKEKIAVMTIDLIMSQLILFDIIST